MRRRQMCGRKGRKICYWRKQSRKLFLWTSQHGCGMAALGFHRKTSPEPRQAGKSGSTDGGDPGTSQVDIAKKALLVLCADNGVVEEGVTQTGQEVTAQVAENFLQEKATAGILCRKTGGGYIPGGYGNLPGYHHTELQDRYGTQNMTKGPAMSGSRRCRCWRRESAWPWKRRRRGYRILATGEMGIGNTTTSSAMASVFLGRPAEELTGRGAGLSSEGLNRKIQAIKKGRCPEPAGSGGSGGCAGQGGRIRYRRNGRCIPGRRGHAYARCH